MPARDGDAYIIIPALTAIVALAAGYVATDKGQRALDDITAARYLAPLDVFVFSILAAILSSIASRRFQALDDFPAIFLMIAASATADILLQCRSLGWIVYVPCVILLMLLVYKVSRLLFSWVSTAILPLLLVFFIHGIRMLKRMVTEGPGAETV